LSATMGYVTKIMAQTQEIATGIEIDNGSAIRAIALQPAIIAAVVEAMTRNFWALENMVVGCLMCIV